MKNAALNKILAVLFGIFLSIVGIELLLRLCGFGYNLLHPLPKDTGAEYRILCIGESTTFGIGASDPRKKSYPHQLEGMLNDNLPTKKVQCFFDQTIGQNTSEISRKFPFYVNKYKPNLVIFMVGINNWWNLDRSNILLFDKNKIVSHLYFKTLVFMDRFRVWKLIKWLYFSLRLPEDRWNYWFGDRANSEIISYLQTVKEKYNFDIFNQLIYYDLRAMIDFCRLHQIRAIICSYPRGEGVAKEVNPILRKSSIEFNVLFVDNETYFKKHPRYEEYFSVDRWHPNDKGYRLVAQHIYNCILDNKLIE